MDGTKLEGKPDPGVQGDFQDMEPIHKNHQQVSGPGFDKPEASRLSRPVEQPMNQADQAMKRMIDDDGDR